MVNFEKKFACLSRPVPVQPTLRGDGRHTVVVSRATASNNAAAASDCLGFHSSPPPPQVLPPQDPPSLRLLGGRVGEWVDGFFFLFFLCRLLLAGKCGILLHRGRNGLSQRGEAICRRAVVLWCGNCFYAVHYFRYVCWAGLGCRRYFCRSVNLGRDRRHVCIAPPEVCHLGPHDALLAAQRAALAREALVRHQAARALELAVADLVGRELRQRGGQAAEVAGGVVVAFFGGGGGVASCVFVGRFGDSIAVFVWVRGVGGGRRGGDARHKGRVFDELLVALGLEEGVVDDRVRAVDLARGQGVGEALDGFEAEGFALRRGGGGDWGLLKCWEGRIGLARS